MSRDHLRRKTPEPVVKRNLLKVACGKYFQYFQVRIARVLDIVTCDSRHKSDVICVEVHCARPMWQNYSHTRLAAYVVLPFRSVRMPVHFTQTTRLNGCYGSRDIFRRQEGMGVSHADFTASGLTPSRLLKKSESLQRSSVECVQWRMRGTDQQQSHVFSYISPEQRVRRDHPLRPIRTMVDEILKQLSPQFNKMYAKVGRPSIPPEQLLRAQLLQMLYSVRSERLLMEEMDYNILFRWFVGLNLDDPVWDATVFTKNRDRLLEAEVAKEFLGRVVAHAREQGWTSDEHFTVDGTLLEAWASLKSFQRKDQKDSFSAGGSGKSHGGFSWGEALEPDARIEERSRSPVGAQGQGQGGEVELQRKSAGGESSRIDRG